MGAGHLAVGIGLKAAAPSTNAGWWVFCAFLADLLLGIFALLGLEQAHGFAEFPQRHYLTFTFPYSHGLLATCFWAAAAAIGGILLKRTRAFITLAVSAVFSHFVLDAIAHVPELPLVGNGSPVVGLSLWNRLPVELGLEAGMVAVALVLYFSSVDRKTFLRGWGVVAFAVIWTAVMIAGQAFSTELPPRGALISGWMFPALFFAAAVGWLDRRVPAQGSR